MKMFPGLLLAGLAVVLIACRHQSKNGNGAQTDTVVIDRAITRNDTLLVQGKWIIFFQPSPAEYEDMQRRGEGDNALYATATQFYRYMTLMVDSLKQTSWANHLQITSQRVIYINLNKGRRVLINRSEADNMVGVIFTDGKKAPQVDYGVQTDRGWRNEMHRFFGLDQ